MWKKIIREKLTDKDIAYIHLILENEKRTIAKEGREYPQIAEQCKREMEKVEKILKKFTSIRVKADEA